MKAAVTAIHAIAGYLHRCTTAAPRPDLWPPAVPSGGSA